MRNTIIFTTTFLTLLSGFISALLYSVIPLIVFLFFFTLSAITIYDAFIQKSHSLLRNFPFVGRLRWLFEGQRPKIQQYFVEDNLNGQPFSKEQRSIVYQRSKNEIETVPFGTQHNVYEKGHEFVKHSIFPKHSKLEKIFVGTKHCAKPYVSSIVNISAMSYGSLSGAAIRSLNLGAEKGEFAHNTGEGGISPHHLKGGDLIFQIGTGYFGAGFTENGVRVFDESMYKVNSNLPQVKMVELKLSQGAKPGHGGILPAKKNTEEISQIRGVEPNTRVDSPPFHTAFDDFNSMVDFIKVLRKGSGGKPIGIKLCVTSEDEIEDMINTFAQRDNYPDFITVDGSEGGTGSAPLEFSNNVGTPLFEGLRIINKHLERVDLKEDIRVFASGKMIDGFDIVKALSLGADGVNMARGFMMSLGCIQARECNLDTCPVGVATQDKSLEKALVVKDKFERVYNFHTNTLKSVSEIIGSMGLNSQFDLNSSMIYRRIGDGTVKTLKEFYV